jgi:hypothetical protein
MQNDIYEQEDEKKEKCLKKGRMKSSLRRRDKQEG